MVRALVAPFLLIYFAYNISWVGLYEIGLCTSTRWSLRTWQLLLMFYWDRVNRLLEQTQRRAYGCALLALRQVGTKKKFFLLGGWALIRLQKYNQHVLTYDQPARIISTSILASPLLLYSIGALYYITPINNIHACRREAHNKPFYPPTFQKPLIYPPLKAFYLPAFIII